jgi:integrase
MEDRMARQINRLSAKAVNALTQAKMHADGNGLYLRVDPSGAKRWVFVFKYNRKRKEMGLGPVVDVGLADAREEARKARAQVRAGQNPIDERKKQKVSLLANSTSATFGDIADQLIDDLSPGWKSPVHLRQWKTTLSVDAARLRSLHINAIDTDDVLGVLRPIWSTKPETASRLRCRIERVLDAAKAKKLRTGENPARWKGHLALLLPRRLRLTRGHHAALPYDRMSEFMTRLRRSGSLSSKALQLTILTAARTSEVRFARVDEFNLEKSVWIIPAQRMKRGVAHRVPLSPQALALVRSLIESSVNDQLFPGLQSRRDLSRRSAMSNMAMPKLLSQLGYGEFTVHGFRSTFRDWASDCTMFPREAAEAALSHVVGDAVEQSYRRGDALELRRRLMNAWASFCDGAPIENVHSLAA